MKSQKYNYNFNASIKHPSGVFGEHRRTGLRLTILLALWVAATAWATPITVPNGDFSDPGNDGSIGGLLGTDIVNQPIGSGPWHGTSLGVAGLLAQPTLTIDSSSQTATISGLLGINVGGLLNNGGYFEQALTTSYQFGRFYIVSVEIDAATPLSLGLLDDVNVGAALTASGVPIAASTVVDPELVELRLVEDELYELRFGYLADVAASGFISLRLFNEPTGLLTASLLDTVTFSNVQLEGRDIGPASAISVETTGDLLQAEVGQPFGEPIIAVVRDGDGNGVPGFAVVISAPLTGASADLSAPSSADPPGNVINAVSDLDGVVEFFAEANDEPGCYVVTVEALDQMLGIAPAVFHLRNWSNDPGEDSIYCNGFQ